MRRSTQEASKLAIPNEYDKLMSAIGADGTNAFTSYDMTVYTDEIPSNQIDNWAKIQSDRFANAVIRGFHTELETVYEEYNMSLTDDGGRMFDSLMVALYPHHPYGMHTVLGTQEDLKNPSITNIKNYYTEEEWDKLRQDDGHIYWINQFQNIKGEEKSTTHNDEAFWIQTRVLEWAGYPEVHTLDQYFDLLESYVEANPTMEDGTENIAYTILCEDWRYYCLENAPQFLDGYPNDGSVIVDPEELKIIDYNTTPTAKRYFEKLNDEYQKGIVDPESFTQTYDEYIAKLSTGRVLGMVDQWWNFAYSVNDSLKQQGLDEKGCSYVPLPITIDEGIRNQWHNSGGVLNVGSGLGISTSCDDVEGALQFIDDLLSQEIHDLRFWGVEGTDYEVGDDGLFYRTEEQRTQAADTAYKASHICTYSYFPQYNGTSDDGINAMKPEEQPGEFFDSLNSAVQRCFEAYGCETYVDMLGTNEAPGPWYPMYSYSNTMTTSTPGGVAWTKMGEIKHEYLPRVVMAPDFEEAWDEYMDVYEDCDPQAFLDEMQAELDRRIEEAAKYE